MAIWLFIFYYIKMIAHLGANRAPALRITRRAQRHPAGNTRQKTPCNSEKKIVHVGATLAVAQRHPAGNNQQKTPCNSGKKPHIGATLAVAQRHPVENTGRKHHVIPEKIAHIGATLAVAQRHPRQEIQNNPSRIKNVPFLLKMRLFIPLFR